MSEYDEAVNIARGYGWTLGEEPGTLPAKIAADRVARIIQERGQRIAMPAFDSHEYRLMRDRGERLTLKSDAHRRASDFWKRLPAYLKAVEACEAKFGTRQ